MLLTQEKSGRLRSFLFHPPIWLTLMACAGILALRKPDAFYNPQFWGEDGPNFYKDALLMGPKAFFEVYASYLHTVARCVGALATWFDPKWAPTVFVGSALAFTLYAAARTQSARCPLPRHAGCALAVVLVPDAFEVLLNITNLQWINFGSLLLILISADAKRWWQHLHDGVMVLLFGLSGPFSIIVAPLFLWRAWQRRTAASLIVSGLALVAAGVQAWTVWHYPPGTQDSPVALEALLAVPGMRITGSLLLGTLVPQDFSRGVEIVLGLVALAAVTTLAQRKGAFRLERIWLGLAFAGLLASTLFRCRYVLPDLCHAVFGSRYFFPLQLITVWLILAAAADERRWVARTGGALALWCLLINTPRLREGAYDDLQWKNYAAHIREGRAIVVPVNPRPWEIVLPERKAPSGAGNHSGGGR
jgi:hypothetical protein